MSLKAHRCPPLSKQITRAEGGCCRPAPELVWMEEGRAELLAVSQSAVPLVPRNLSESESSQTSETQNKGPPCRSNRQKVQIQKRFKTFVPLNSVIGQLLLKTEFGPVQELSDYFVK
jgi:hypothetical protein